MAHGRHLACLVLTVAATAACGQDANGEPRTQASPSAAGSGCVVTVERYVPLESPTADPEGITDVDGTVYVTGLDGSLMRGSISGEAGTGPRVFAPATPTREFAGGVRGDGHGHLVVAGLSSRVVDVVDAATGVVVSSQATGNDTTPNDLVVHGGFLYVTDTSLDRVLRAPLDAAGQLGSFEIFAELRPLLSGANGITLTPDSSAVLVVGTNRGLVRVDLQSRAVEAVRGADGVMGDGLHLFEGRLYSAVFYKVFVMDVDADGHQVRQIGQAEPKSKLTMSTLTTSQGRLVVVVSNLRPRGVHPSDSLGVLDVSACR